MLILEFKSLPKYILINNIIINWYKLFNYEYIIVELFLSSILFQFINKFSTFYTIIIVYIYDQDSIYSLNFGYSTWIISLTITYYLCELFI